MIVIVVDIVNPNSEMSDSSMESCSSDDDISSTDLSTLTIWSCDTILASLSRSHDHICFHTPTAVYRTSIPRSTGPLVLKVGAALDSGPDRLGSCCMGTGPIP